MATQAPDPVKTLEACGLTQDYSKELAKEEDAAKHVQANAIGFIQNHWLSIKLGELDHIFTKAEMQKAFVKLHIRPEVVAAAVSRPLHEDLLGHRDTISHATLTISGEYERHGGHGMVAAA